MSRPETSPLAFRSPSIAVVGCIGLEQRLTLDRFPSWGAASTIVAEELNLTGRSALIALAAALLGAGVTLFASAGTDHECAQVRSLLLAGGVADNQIRAIDGESTGLSITMAARDDSHVMKLVRNGVCIARGHRLDVADLFDHDVVILDVEDVSLRRFLLDLPAHTQPRARLLGTLASLPGAGDDIHALMPRHDAVIGNAAELRRVTGTDATEAAIARVRTLMRGENLRGVVLQTADGGLMVTPSDSSGLTECIFASTETSTSAFVAAGAFALACRWPTTWIIAFACAAASLAGDCFPTIDETIEAATRLQTEIQ